MVKAEEMEKFAEKRLRNLPNMGLSFQWSKKKKQKVAENSKNLSKEGSTVLLMAKEDTDKFSSRESFR